MEVRAAALAGLPPPTTSVGGVPGPAVEFDRDYVVCSLDLISSLGEGLSKGLEPLIAGMGSKLLDIAVQCCRQVQVWGGCLEGGGMEV